MIEDENYCYSALGTKPTKVLLFHENMGFQSVCVLFSCTANKNFSYFKSLIRKCQYLLYICGISGTLRFSISQTPRPHIEFSNCTEPGADMVMAEDEAATLTIATVMSINLLDNLDLNVYKKKKFTR